MVQTEKLYALKMFDKRVKLSRVDSVSLVRIIETFWESLIFSIRIFSIYIEVNRTETNYYSSLCVTYNFKQS